MNERKVEEIAVDLLAPYQNNARTHSPKQVEEIARSIKVYGFTSPVLADENNVILAGHGRVMAAKLLGMDKVPVLRIEHLTAAEKVTRRMREMPRCHGWQEAAGLPPRGYLLKCAS